MLLPEFTIRLVESKLTEYCDQKIPVHARDKVKLIHKITGNKVTLIEARPFYCEPSTWTETPIAQFRFDNETKKWALYFLDRNSKWHLYDLIKPSVDFQDMLKALDSDKTGILWG